MLKYIEITSNACAKVVSLPLIIFKALSNLIDIYNLKQGYNYKLSDEKQYHNDWNKIGEDMWRSILNYDQKLTQKKEER